MPLSSALYGCPWGPFWASWGARGDVATSSLSAELQTEERPPFADVSLTLWRELAMLTAPTAGQLENVSIAVTLQDYAVGFVAVQVQEQLQWNGANNMMEHVQQGAAGRAAGLGVGDRAHYASALRGPWCKG